MKTLFQRCFVPICVFGISNFSTFAQGTSFTYQGRLNLNSFPGNGSFDFAFSLFATNTNGAAIAGPITNTATPVSNGLFTVTLNFGNVFTGSSNWLDISVRTNGNGSFTNLSPRQQIFPVPYAMFAPNAGSASIATTATTAGSAGAFSGSLSGDVTGTQSATVVSSVGSQSASAIANGVTAANASTNAPTPGTIVKRDQFGNFSASVISVANLNLTNVLNLPDPAKIFGGSGLVLYNNIVNEDVYVGNAGNPAALNAFTTDNTAIGYEALHAITASGGGETAVGAFALFNDTGGLFNTAIGGGTLQGNLTGTHNIALGYSAGNAILGDSNIDIGNTGLATDTNIIRIGNTQTSTYIAGVINGNGAGLTNISTPTTGNYIFAYDNSIQTLVSTGTFKNVSFNFNGQANGWSHGLGSPNFSCPQTGVYLIQYTAIAKLTTPTAVTISLIGTQNETEIPGSQASLELNSTTTSGIISKSFISPLLANDVLNLQFSASSTAAELFGPQGDGTTKPSVSLTIIRIQ